MLGLLRTVFRKVLVVNHCSNVPEAPVSVIQHNARTGQDRTLALLQLSEIQPLQIVIFILVIFLNFFQLHNRTSYAINRLFFVVHEESEN